MNLLILTVALQIQAVPPADSAMAVAALDNATRALGRSGPGGPYSDITGRYWTQLQTWKTPDEIWRAARAHDVAGPPGTRLTAWALAEAFRSGDDDLALRRLRSLRPGERDSVAADLAFDVPSFSDAATTGILALTRTPHVRATLLEARARKYAHDGEGAAAWSALGEAIRLMRPLQRNSPAYAWAYQLRTWGGPIPLDSLIALVLEMRGPLTPGAWSIEDTLFARIEVAQRVAGAEPGVAAALADTLLPRVPDDDLPRHQHWRLALYNLRGGPGDSERALAVRDSFEARLPAWRPADAAKSAAWQALMTTTPFRDTTAFRRALRDTALEPASLRHAIEVTVSRTTSILPSDSALLDADTWLRFVFNSAWPVAESFDDSPGDSVRVALISALAAVDPLAALDSATTATIGPAQRDRAVAEAVRGLAEIDIDSAASAAAELRGPEARSAAYLALTERAAANGRPAFATEFAVRTPAGEDRVRAYLAVARAFVPDPSFAFVGPTVEAGASTSAGVALREALDHMHALWRPEGLELLPPPGEEVRGMSRFLLRDVAIKAIRLGMHDDLWRWAARARGDERVSAWLLVSEAIAHVTGKQRILFPIH